MYSLVLQGILYTYAATPLPKYDQYKLREKTVTPSINRHCEAIKTERYTKNYKVIEECIHKHHIAIGADYLRAWRIFDRMFIPKSRRMNAARWSVCGIMCTVIYD